MAKRWFKSHTIGCPPIKQPLALEAEATRFWVPQENGARKRRKSAMSYLNSITLVGFVGSDPEQRQAKGNGSKFTVQGLARFTSCALQSGVELPYRAIKSN